MSGAGGVIIITGKDAAGQQGSGHQVGLASAQAALAILEGQNNAPAAFIAALSEAISDAED